MDRSHPRNKCEKYLYSRPDPDLHVLDHVDPKDPPNENDFDPTDPINPGSICPNLSRYTNTDLICPTCSIFHQTVTKNVGILCTVWYEVLV